MASDSKKKKFKAVSQKVKLFRANDPLLSVFMWGINHSIEELSHVKVPVMLMPDDFKAHTKTRVDNHLFNKENMPSHFKFKEYCPIVFRNLRERFNIEDEDYCNALTKCQPEPTDSSGRSGAKFWTSYDSQYFIKTLVSEEVEEMHHILKQYHWYVVERHAQTLLPHFLGMYRTTVNDQETYLLVMRNVFSPRLTVHKKYDLKGSTVERAITEKEMSNITRKMSAPAAPSRGRHAPVMEFSPVAARPRRGSSTNPPSAKELPTFKDNDFVKDDERIYLGEEQKETFLATLEADTQFLMNQGLMDYSLIIGIHDRDCADDEPLPRPPPPDDDENGLHDEQDEPDAGSPGLPPCEDFPVDGEAEPMVVTPPDSPTSPAMMIGEFTGEIDPKIEVFGVQSCEGAPKNFIYFMAIIDILTRYGMKKRTAKAAKTVKHGKDAEGISTVKPDQYGRRFVEFVSKSIE